MRALRLATLDPLLRAAPRERREPGPHAAARRAVLAEAVLRQPAHDGVAAALWSLRQSQAGATPDAIDGLGDSLYKAAHDRSRRRPPHVSVFAAGCGHHAWQSGLGSRHHLRADGAGLSLPGGRARLAQ